MLRKLLSILLLAVLGLPLATSLLASIGSTETSLPACCRRAGKHHCSMGNMAATGSDTPHLRAPADLCPFAPGNLPQTAHLDLALAAAILFAALLSHPSVHAQTQSLWRISRDRSRQKRGPPVLLPSLSV